MSVLRKVLASSDSFSVEKSFGKTDYPVIL